MNYQVIAIENHKLNQLVILNRDTLQISTGEYDASWLVDTAIKNGFQYTYNTMMYDHGLSKEKKFAKCFQAKGGIERFYGVINTYVLPEIEDLVFRFPSTTKEMKWVTDAVESGITNQREAA